MVDATIATTVKSNLKSPLQTTPLEVTSLRRPRNFLTVLEIVIEKQAKNYVEDVESH